MRIITNKELNKYQTAGTELLDLLVELRIALISFTIQSHKIQKSTLSLFDREDSNSDDGSALLTEKQMRDLVKSKKNRKKIKKTSESHSMSETDLKQVKELANEYDLEIKKIQSISNDWLQSRYVPFITEIAIIFESLSEAPIQSYELIKLQDLKLEPGIAPKLDLQQKQILSSLIENNADVASDAITKLEEYWRVNQFTQTEEGIFEEYIQRFETYLTNASQIEQKIKSKYPDKTQLQSLKQELNALYGREKMLNESVLKNAFVVASGIVGTVTSLAVTFAPLTFGTSIIASAIGIGVAGIATSASQSMKLKNQKEQLNQIEEEINLAKYQIQRHEELALYIQALNFISDNANADLGKMEQKLKTCRLILNNFYQTLSVMKSILQDKEHDNIYADAEHIFYLLKSDDSHNIWLKLKEWSDDLSKQRITTEVQRENLEQIYQMH